MVLPHIWLRYTNNLTGTNYRADQLREFPLSVWSEIREMVIGVILLAAVLGIGNP